jgi:hypothetical protein
MRRLDRPTRTKLFTIALILDFMSPASSKVLHQPFPPIERIVLYPVRAQDPDLAMPSCDHPLEKFMSTQGLRDWSGKLQKDAKAGRPLVASFEKIRFDIQFGLHPINQVVVNVPDGDSCKKNVCEELLKLEKTVRDKGRKLELVEVSPLGCKLPKNAAITLVSMSGASASEIVNEVKTLAMKKPTEAEIGRSLKVSPSPIPLPSPAPSIEPAPLSAIVELQGPPVKVRFVQAEPSESAKTSPALPNTAIVAQAPTTVKVPPGKWKVSIQSPSWTKDISGLEIDLREREKRVLQLQKNFDDQLTWLESQKKQDQLLVFDLDGVTHRVLVPAGSPPIPMPKNIDWKVFPVPSPSSEH